MKTSYFAVYEGGGNGVSIACSAPKSFNGKTYDDLVPSWSLVNKYKKGVIDKKTYVNIYKLQVLNKLNPKKVYKDLKDKILLCWEGPGNFCHRIIVAKWIEEELEIKVPEL